MGITGKLYEEDAYRKEFQAVVSDCREIKKGWALILDITAFYPEGGGQPADQGILTSISSGETVRVFDVHEKDGEILHYVDHPLPVGCSVSGSIDWERRFDLMQQHSGEHIVSGLIHSRYGYDNVGFHMGADVITIDFNGVLTAGDLAQVEKAANQVIYSNAHTQIFFPEPDELEKLEYRSKKELTGKVRIVRFPGADTCACCGTHVAQAGEIGMVKLLSVVRFHDGVRIEMISGSRVLDYINVIAGQNHQISVRLSAKADQTAQAVERLGQENYALKGRVARLEEKVFAALAKEMEGRGDVLLFEEDMDADSVRRLADAVMQTCQGRCAVFSRKPDESFMYAIGQAGGDLRAMVKDMNAALSGRGGGKPFFVQGQVKAGEEQIRNYFVSGEGFFAQTPSAKS